MQTRYNDLKVFWCLREQFAAEDGVGHTVTSFMIKESSDWFDKFLKKENMTSH